MVATLERTAGQIPEHSKTLGSDDGGWARSCAMGGAAVWAALALLAHWGVAHFGAIELLFLFAPLVIVPLGLELGHVLGFEDRIFSMARRVQPAAALMAVAAIWIAPGGLAGALACGWLAFCLLVALSGVWSLVSAYGTHTDANPLVRLAVSVARIDLAVGGMWLVSSRLLLRPMGIQEPIGLLTAVHFHFAGFATAMIAAATLHSAGSGGRARVLRGLVPLIIGMPYVVAAGFVISPRLKMLAAVLFSLSVALLAIFLLRCGRGLQARVWFRVAAVCVFAGMALSAIYAIADFLGSDILPIPRMAHTHGVLNAVGFCTAALLGWLVE